MSIHILRHIGASAQLAGRPARHSRATLPTPDRRPPLPRPLRQPPGPAAHAQSAALAPAGPAGIPYPYPPLPPRNPCVSAAGNAGACKRPSCLASSGPLTRPKLYAAWLPLRTPMIQASCRRRPARRPFPRRESAAHPPAGRVHPLRAFPCVGDRVHVAPARPVRPLCPFAGAAGATLPAPVSRAPAQCAARGAPGRRGAGGRLVGGNRGTPGAWR